MKPSNQGSWISPFTPYNTAWMMCWQSMATSVIRFDTDNLLERNGGGGNANQEGEADVGDAPNDNDALQMIQQANIEAV